MSENEIKEKCVNDMQHSTRNYLKTLQENVEITSLGKYQDDSFSLTSPSFSSLAKISFNTSIDEVSKDILDERECPINDINQKDNNTFSDRVKGSVRRKQRSRKGFGTLKNVSDIPLIFNCPTKENEQSNIVECLLDLDDYLDKMDGSCLEDTSDFKLKASTLVMTNNKSSSIRMQNFLNSNTQFERNSKFRSTIDCLIHTPKTAPEVLSIHGTWNNKSGKSSLKQPENESNSNTFDSNFDINRINPCCLTNTGAPETSRGVNTVLEKTSGKTNGLQILTNEQIFQNLIEQQQNVQTDRPRQFGRRAEYLSILSPSLNYKRQDCTHINYENRRTINAVCSTSIPEVCFQHDMLYTESDGSTSRTSRNTTPVSIESSTDSGESLEISETLNEENNTVNEENDQQSTQLMDTESMNSCMKYGFNSYWPHDYSRTFALIACTLGLFNASRFAILTINYGGNFLIQFCILSMLFGIPFLWLQMSLGTKIKAGPISMWRISPICVGIGISITFVQFFITVYSTIVVVWILKFIQDLLIYKSSYVWSSESIHYVGNQQFSYANLTESIPYYFNVNVLQRIKILKMNDEKEDRFHINDRIAFYLVFVWVAVFLILCRGLKSLGKYILLLGVLPIVFLAVVAVKFLCVVDIAKLQNTFISSEFDDFLVNSKTWTAAAQEVFFTWGLFGASVIAISSRTHKKPSNLTLRKDAILVVIVTIFGLCLAALVGLCSIQILNELDYVYVPGSFEIPNHYSAIFSLKFLKRPNLISYPTKVIPHYSTLVGEVYRRHVDTTNISGYQVLRFVTEILPAAVAVSTEKISWTWTLILFIAFFLFGLSQLCVMWKPISCILGNSTIAVLMSCVTGLLLSLPFVTEIGITLIYYIDIVLGGAWFIPILWSAEIFGIFLIRGRPYNGDDLVNNLKMSGSMSAFLALSWNILLPIGLITLAIIEYKISLSNQFYYWRGKSYFNYWARKVGAVTQIGFLVCVPITSIIQLYRYLTSGPADILDRIQMLYRPSDEIEGNQGNYPPNRIENGQDCVVQRFQNDYPPKYTPPPSYTTATGAKLAKLLRQSFRQSVRRLLRESERISITNGTHTEQTSYRTGNNSILTREETSTNIRESIELESRPSVNFIFGRSLSLGRKQMLNKCRFKETNLRPLPKRPNSIHSTSNRRSSHTLYNRPYTAEDVITILKPSTLERRNILRLFNLRTEPSFRSVENLVENAELPNLDPAIVHENIKRKDENPRV